MMASHAEALICLPNFRNLGVLIRLVLLAEAISFGFAFIRTPGLVGFIALLGQTPFYEVVLLSLLVVLFVASPRLALLPYPAGIAVVMIIATIMPLPWLWLFEWLLPGFALANGVKASVTSAMVAALLLAYFDWRQRRLSPAVSEARLQALQARIRPHFLFNSLNTVLGLIREDPRTAEVVLENLADLFRASMAESSRLVPLQRELALARAYAEVEAIRLGPRLEIDWQVDPAALDALLPPLVLQPLLENAVHHGVEPRLKPGKITVQAVRRGDRLIISLRNGFPNDEDRSTTLTSGNQMAMRNIRERLDLVYDAEAGLSTYRTEGEFVVQLHLPYRPDEADNGEA